MERPATSFVLEKICLVMGMFYYSGRSSHGFAMQKIVLISFFLLGIFSAFSQTTLWSEDFTYDNGTQSGTASGPSASDWTTNLGNRLSVRNNAIRGRNLRGEGVWQTDPINI